MKFKEYLKDRRGALLIAASAWCVMLIFMAAYHASAEQLVLFSAIAGLTGAVILLYEYLRRRDFYRGLAKNLEALDQKYLIAETVETPDFIEGQIVHETLQEACRSMYEQTAAYRRASNEFREYIELWVHEVKLPLASLMLMCHNHPDVGGKYGEQLRRIDDYVENVLYYARSENARRDYLIKETSLKRVFANIAVRHREALLQRGVSIHTHDLDMNVMTDGKWLEYMLGQLLSNSLKYFPSDRAPEIAVFAEDFPDKTVLHFRDNGIGIPAGDLPYVFEKSFTGENGRISAKSTGMGLYIVRQLCDRLGHAVRVESARGDYTDIILTFGKNDIVTLKERNLS